jgi:hypothetical protein
VNDDNGGKVTGNGGNVIGGGRNGGIVSPGGLGMLNGNGGIMVNGSGGMVSGGAGGISCFNARRLRTTGITPSDF